MKFTETFSLDQEFINMLPILKILPEKSSVVKNYRLEEIMCCEMMFVNIKDSQDEIFLNLNTFDKISDEGEILNFKDFYLKLKDYYIEQELLDYQKKL